MKTLSKGTKDEIHFESNEDNIKRLLSKLTSSTERNFLDNNYRNKYLLVPITEFIKYNLDQKKVYILNSIKTHNLTLTNEMKELLMVITEILPRKEASLKLLDMLINILAEYFQMKSKLNKIEDNLIWITKINHENENDKRIYSLEDVKLMLFNFVKENNDKYLREQTEKLNFAIKEEYEIVFAKRIEYYRNLYNEYKTKLVALSNKINQKFPNSSLISKIKRKFNKIIFINNKIKKSINFNKLNKAYGQICSLNRKIHRDINELNQNNRYENNLIKFLSEKNEFDAALNKLIEDNKEQWNKLDDGNKKTIMYKINNYSYLNIDKTKEIFMSGINTNDTENWDDLSDSDWSED